MRKPLNQRSHIVLCCFFLLPFRSFSLSSLFLSFFLSFSFSLGDAWANWLLVGACGLSTLACLVYPETYRRLSVDNGKDYPVVQSA